MEERARIPVGPPVSNPLPSYWHEPKSPLANVIEPATDQPTKPYDYAIIGSGISGTMIAYNLLNNFPSSRIVMIEAREICGGATGRNGGHTKAASYRTYLQHREELGKDEALKIARLEYSNIVETHRLASDVGIKCDSALCRTVDILYDDESFQKGKEAIEAIREDAMGVEKDLEKMAWYEINETESNLRERFWTAENNANPETDSSEKVVGAFEYLAGRIHAYRFTTGILKECVKKGLQLCTNTPVHAVRRIDAPPTSTSRWNVFTQYNTITTANVVFATNGYSPYLIPTLQGAIVPMRGQITAQRPGKNTRLPEVLPQTYSFIYRDGYEYMVPRPLPDGGQHIIIGGGLGRLLNAGASEYGTVDDSRLNIQISRYLRESLKGYFGSDNWGEAIEEKPEDGVVQEWTGIMGATADGRPFVGEFPNNEGMWISAGFNGHGMVLCLKCAQAIASMMKDGKEKDIDWFPKSFLITETRLNESNFRGRTNMSVSDKSKVTAGPEYGLNST